MIGLCTSSYVHVFRETVTSIRASTVNGSGHRVSTGWDEEAGGSSMILTRRLRVYAIAESAPSLQQDTPSYPLSSFSRTAAPVAEDLMPGDCHRYP